MHYRAKVQKFPDFTEQVAIPTSLMPRRVGSCACREVSDCSSGRRKINAPSHADDRTVVCGRGKGAYNRPGNKRFRSLIRSYLPSYLNAPNKLQKGAVIQRIAYDAEAQGLQFVRKTNDLRDEWCELDAKERRDKIGHAIREAVADQKNHTSGSLRKKSAQSPTEMDYDALNMISSDCTISTTHSLDGSEDLDIDLEDRRSRFDRMLESFRLGLPATHNKQTITMDTLDDVLPNTNASLFQV